jgi:hypothetical protein
MAVKKSSEEKDEKGKENQSETIKQQINTTCKIIIRSRGNSVLLTSLFSCLSIIHHSISFIYKKGKRSENDNIDNRKCKMKSVKWKV